MRYSRHGSLYLPDPNPRRFFGSPGVGVGRSGGGAAMLVPAAPGGPQITSIVPVTGSEDGGEPVTINGSGFLNGVPVTIGGAALTSITYVSSSQITGLTPVGTVGDADVVVGGATLAAGFEFTAAGSFLTPDIIHNESFETSFGLFHGFGGGPVSQSTRSNVVAGADGDWAVLRNLPITAPGSANDIGGGLDVAFYHPVYGVADPGVSFDRLWTRFYFRIEVGQTIPGTLKFHQLFGDNSYGPQFSGMYINGGIGSKYLCSFFTPENDGSGGIGRGQIAYLPDLEGAWHWLEMDYWRNGDTSNGGNDYPSVGLWLDGTPITSFLNGAPVAPASWIGGRLNFGTRASSAQIGVAHWLGVLNGGNAVAGSIRVDRISVSSVGRIGP